MSGALYRFDDLDTSPIRYQVDKMIPDGVTTGFLWAQRTSGKTLLAINAALAIGNEIPFMGHETIRGRTVLIAGEGFGGIGIRIKAALLAHRREVTEAVAQVALAQGDEAARSYAASLPPYTADNLIVMDKRFPLHFQRNDRPGEILEGVMRELARLNTPGPDEDPETFPYVTLVILDALANFKGQLSLSSSSSAGRITDTMHWMAEQLQCCVLALAHPTADGKKMLGAERLGDSADFIIHVEPDEVSAPGALKTATVSCDKSKDDKEFDPFGYQIRTWKWDEPVVVDGQPTGETEEISGATVELIKADQDSRSPVPRREPGPDLPPPALRENVPVRPWKRTGLKQNRPQLHAVPDLPAPRTETPARPPRVTGILSVPCPDPGCAALGGGMSCNPGVTPREIVALSLDPPLCAHADRVFNAALAGRITEADLDEIIDAMRPAAPRQEPDPEPPAAPVIIPDSDISRRLWWTEVRPESRV